MTNTFKMKISWRNDLRQSIVEKDVQRLRNQLKTIQDSPELKMNDNRLNIRERESNSQ